MIEDIYAKSNREIAIDLGKRLRAYRKQMGFSIKAMAEKSGISEYTIGAFERGDNPGISFLSLIALMRTIEQLDRITELLPDLPVSPKKLFEHQHIKSGR